MTYNLTPKFDGKIVELRGADGAAITASAHFNLKAAGHTADPKMILLHSAEYHGQLSFRSSWQVVRVLSAFEAHQAGFIL
jgi:hypothetical protein